MAHPTRLAFAHLRRDLLRRRWQRIERPLRAQLILIAALLGAFAFWQLRVRYAGIAITQGAPAAGAALLASLAGLALAGGLGTALRLARRLRRSPVGPAWLALPAPVDELLRLQAWEAELPMRVLAVPALAAALAAARLAEPVAWGSGLLLFPIAWAGCCRAGAWAARTLALRVAALSLAHHAARDERQSRATLSATWPRYAPRHSRERARAGSWRRLPPVLALVAKDLRLAMRARAPRATLVLAVALSLASVAVWSAPAPAVRGLAFAVALLAIAAFGEWLVALGASDPFAVLRSLPVGVGAIWASRMLLAAAAIALLVVAHGFASGAAVPVLRVSLAWLTLTGLAILALAVNLQLTLYPQREPATRLFALMLGLALVCSIMIPLLGWVVLLAVVLYSSRRLSRWWRLEDVA